MFILYEIQAYYQQATFISGLGQAILKSPNFNVVTSTCLTFLYKMTSESIQLYVNVTRSNAQSSRVLMITFGDQSNYPGWSTASVNISFAFKQILFVADKMGYSAAVDWADIDNITLSNAQCTSEGKPLYLHIIAFSYVLQV